MIDASFINKTLNDLVKINSVNPSLEQGGAGERDIGNYIHNALLSLGFDSTIETLAPKRVNIIGKRKGTGNGKSLMLNAHMDTVGVLGMADPFEAGIKDGRLYGRGAYDMKGSIASILGVAKAVSENNIQLSGDLILTFVADEEYESLGASELIKSISADACIVTEPTGLKICLGHRGFGVYEITTEGKIAHGGLHQEGIDANLKMGLVLNELNNLSKQITANNYHPLCGQASLHVPLINGGQSLFIYSGSCTIQVERRTLPGEKEQEVFDELKKILNDLEAQDKDFKATIKQIIWRNPHEIEKESVIVKTLAKSVGQFHTPEFIGHTWWEDSGLFGEAGIPTVIVGPKGGGIHQQVEWVELESLEILSEILLQTTVEFCK